MNPVQCRFGMIKVREHYGNQQFFKPGLEITLTDEHLDLFPKMEEYPNQALCICPKKDSVKGKPLELGASEGVWISQDDHMAPLGKLLYVLENILIRERLKTIRDHLPTWQGRTNPLRVGLTKAINAFAKEEEERANLDIPGGQNLQLIQMYFNDVKQAYTKMLKEQEA